MPLKILPVSLGHANSPFLQEICKWLNLEQIPMKCRDGPLFATSRYEYTLTVEVASVDAKFDIFRKLPDGNPVWMKAVEGLEEAKHELRQIAKHVPGEYFIYDTRNGSVISTERNNTLYSLASQSDISINLSD